MDSSRADLSTPVPGLPPSKNLEFPPLSQRPRVDCAMPMNNPVDQFVPEKFTPLEPGQDENHKAKKDLHQVLPKTEEMISNGFKQVKHAKAITMELKLLLEHEQKLLQQVITRIDKFKNLRDENKRKATEWETEYKTKLPDYDAYATKLVNVPQSKPIPVEGLPAPIQQKILYQIVSRTSNTADRVVVSLSMEQTVANDIDLTLGSLKKHCTVILKRIRGWLKMLETHECQQNVVLERWEKHKQSLRDMKKQTDERTVTQVGSAMSMGLIKQYEDRLKRLETAICNMGGEKYGAKCGPEDARGPGGTSGPGGPGGPGGSGRGTQDDRLARIERAVCMLGNNAYEFCSQNMPQPNMMMGPQDDCSPSQNSSQEARLAKIEDILCKLVPSAGTCNKSPLPKDQRFRRIENAICSLAGPRGASYPFCGQGSPQPTQNQGTWC